MFNLSNRLLKALKSRWRNSYYRLLGVKLQGYVWMREIEIPCQFNSIQLADNCSLDRGVTLLCSGEPQPQPKIDIGVGTYINRHTFLDAITSLTIGQYCAIGPGCYITDHDHGTDLNFTPLEQPMISKPTQIGNRVWIGANVTILKGVTIGDDSVIGAGSVVTKSIPAKVIAVGMPARVIKMRKVNSNVC